jgi:lon-related putative ATP-dependent protease
MTALPPDTLRHRCDPMGFAFATTEELPDPAAHPGQSRALEALQMGMRMRGNGYNVFACGPTGTGRRRLIQAELRHEAARRPVPVDWCYVHNFGLPSQPAALRLPAGRGQRLREDMRALVQDVQTALPAAFGREENRNRQEEIEEEFQERQHKVLSEISARALEDGILLLETQSGFAFAPKDEHGEAMQPAIFQQLPETDQERIKAKIVALQEELQRTLRQFPIWFKEMRERLRTLNREIAQFVVRHLVDEILVRYQDLAEVQAYLGQVATDVVDNAPVFMPIPPQGVPPGLLPEDFDRAEFFHRYAVNLLVDNQSCTGAPVEMLDLPSLGNLLGRIEHRAQMGTFMTDFTLIKPGALHRANGGFLIVDARQILMQPFAWEAFKRALHAREIKLDASELQFSLLTTVSVEPTPIPLDLKVVLVGERWLLYELERGDPEFRDLFKVIADFDDVVPRTTESEQEYAHTFAYLARRAGTRPLSPGAVAAMIEHCSRLVEDAQRLTTHVHSMEEVIREADYWADGGGHDRIDREHILQAIHKQQQRVDRIRERMHESISRGIRLIATDGEVVGQINGLSVMATDSIAFGLPMRITAVTRLGDGRVIDIERETDLGGPTHTKGVLILSSFLARRYASDIPLCMAASITFEQSYGMVDGDSASLAELCALLSSLSEVPILQRYAVTGSVNQRGEVQAIGGVNEKIEGFFDICHARGMVPGQGVIIPATNREHLMLREDIVEAAANGWFSVHAVSTVDEAIALLTGREPGERTPDGGFPMGTFNRAVAYKLAQYSRLRQGKAAQLAGKIGE